jgi:hypothetical protein
MSNDKRISRLERTIKKKIHLQIVRGGRSDVWGGYLLPVEIVHIVDVWKLKPRLTDDWNLVYARERITLGKCDPGWFYFVVTKKDNERLGLGY